jgi:hypothetical protein
VAHRFEHSGGIRQHVVVPEAQDAVAVFLDDGGSGGVVVGIVLAAVELDGEARGAAGEVGDIVVDLELADEFFAFQASAAQAVPQALFGVGLLGAKPAGDWSQAFSSDRSAPSPNPLPTGKRAFRQKAA